MKRVMEMSEREEKERQMKIQAKEKEMEKVIQQSIPVQPPQVTPLMQP
jgi:hypothetical protein